MTTCPSCGHEHQLTNFDARRLVLDEHGHEVSFEKVREAIAEALQRRRESDDVIGFG